MAENNTLRQRAEALARENAAQSPEQIEALSPAEITKTLHKLRVHQIELERQNEELRRMQLELDAARARYFDLYDLAPVGYVTVSEPGLILKANLTAATLLGVARGALVQQLLTRFILKEDQDLYYRHRKQLFETDEPQACELRMVKQDGTAFWSHLEATAAQAADGAPVCRVVLSDITERRQAEAALQESEELYRSILNASPDVITITDLAGRMLMVSLSALTLFGCDREEQMLGHLIVDFIAPEDRDRATSNIGLMHQGAMTGPGEYRGLRADGSTFDVEANAEFIRDAAGQPTRMVFIVRDIAARKQAEAALRDSQARLQRAESVAHFGNWELNLAERQMRASAGASAIYGLHGEEWPLIEAQGVPLPEYRAMLDAALANLIEHQQPYNVEFRIRRPGDGQLRDIHSMAEYDPDRRVVFGVIHDITARKQAEAALRESEERYRNIFNNSVEGIFQTTPVGRYRTVNPAFAHMFGYASPEDMIAAVTDIGRQLYVHPEDRQRLIALMRASDGMVRNFEVQLFRRDGSRFWVSINARMIQAGEGQAPFIEGTCMDITDRKQVEDALRANRRRLTDIIEFLPDATLAIDREKRVIIWNKAIEEMTGIPAEKMIGQGGYAYTIPFYGERRPQLMDLIFEDQAEIAVRYPHITREGDILMVEVFCNALYNNQGAWVIAKASPLHDQFGNVVGAIESIRDITARKQAETALRIQHDLSLALGSSNDLHQALEQILGAALQFESIDCGGIYVVDQSGALDLVVHRGLSPQFIEQTTHYPADALQTRLAREGRPRYGAHQSIYSELGATRAQEDLRALAVIPVAHQGHLLAVLNLASHTHDDIPVNTCHALETLAQQIGSTLMRLRADTALRESEEKYRRLVDNANEVIFVTQGDRLKFVNRMAIDLTGYSERELISMPFTEFIHPDDRSMVVERYLRRLQGDVFQDKYVFRLMTRGGSARWVEIGTVLIDWDGRPATLSFLSDVTARKQAESQWEAALEALRESEERLAHIIDFLPDATLVIDREGKVIAWNRAIEDMTGVSKNEIVGKTDFVHAVPFYGEARPILIDLIFKEHNEIEKEYHFISRKGDQLTAEAFTPMLYKGKGAYLWGTAAPLYDSRGHVVGAIESIRDITESKQAEDALRASHAELQTRNEELDVFAHMVAHDLKTPLGVMMGYAELLAETYATLSTETILQTLNSINRSGRKAANIIESLLMLASVRKQDVPVAPLDMAHIIAEVMARLADSIQDSGADICVPDPAGWPVALGHAPWIEEIWVNYLSNALKYGGPHPRIDLDAARLPPLSATGEGQGGGFIRFSVRDYGPGLTPEQQERLFAPFERLGQARVEGHGLGLSVVRRIAEKLGGQVGVDSQPDTLCGSTFYFTLPAAPDL